MPMLYALSTAQDTATVARSERCRFPYAVLTALALLDAAGDGVGGLGRRGVAG